MRHLIAAVIFCITTGIFLEKISIDRLTIPFRLARLQFQEPDLQLMMPVAGVAVRKVSDTWSAPRPGGRLHQGQDIFAPRGTPVVSATEGIVVRIGTNQLGGKVISVVGAGGRLYYYAHLERYVEGLEVGDAVLEGSTIGYVGSTGNARGKPPHLHFGVYTPAGALNPLPLFVDRVSRSTI